MYLPLLTSKSLEFESQSMLFLFIPDKIFRIFSSFRFLALLGIYRQNIMLEACHGVEQSIAWIRIYSNHSLMTKTQTVSVKAVSYQMLAKVSEWINKEQKLGFHTNIKGIIRQIKSNHSTYTPSDSSVFFLVSKWLKFLHFCRFFFWQFPCPLSRNHSCNYDFVTHYGHSGLTCTAALIVVVVSWATESQGAQHPPYWLEFRVYLLFLWLVAN